MNGLLNALGFKPTVKIIFAKENLFPDFYIRQLMKFHQFIDCAPADSQIVHQFTFSEKIFFHFCEYYQEGRRKKRKDLTNIQ